MQTKSLIPSIAINKFDYSRFFHKLVNDYLIALFFFLISGSIAFIFYRKIGYTHFYQNFIPEAVVWACGHEFAFPKEVVKELIPFLSGKEHTFDCAKLINIELNAEPGAFISAQPYLTWCVAILWKLFGVSYTAISPLVFILFGLYGSGIYLLLRQFLNKLQSTLASIFLCCSPILVYMLPNLRDFSKAPFIIWTLLLLISAVKTSSQHHQRSTWHAILAGFTIALGLGFRADLFIFFPIGILFLLIGISSPKNQTHLRSILMRGKVILLFTGAFAIVAYPIMKNGGISGVGGMFVMQGMTEPFSKTLKLGASGYSTGSAYSDELTLSSIASQERENISNWDELELSGKRGFAVTRAMTISTSNLMKWADLFLADYATQAIKSFTWIIGFPVFIANSGFEFSNPFLSKNPESIIFSIYKSIGHPILLVICFSGLFFLLFSQFIRSHREGYALTFLIIFLCTYPAIQFNLRHFFYLEFIWILCLIYLLSAPKVIKEFINIFNRYLFYVVAILIILLGAYCTLIQFQLQNLSYTIKQLILLPREMVALKVEYTDNDSTYYKVPIPKIFEAIVNAPYDSMTNEITYRGPQWDVRAAAQRYLLSVNGKECTFDQADIVLVYQKFDTTWQPLDSKLRLINSKINQTNSLLFSGFYRASQYFDGILIPKELKNCEIILEKITGASRLPYVFTTNIKSDEINDGSYKKFGFFKED